jgi:threonylcarbamoyladenosine tRNA methylthiotransferase MtaB
MLINISNHPLSEWSERQIDEATRLWGGVVDVAFPKIDATLTNEEIESMAKANIAALRSYLPDVCFSADIIVGFPCESEADFNETAQFLSEARLLHGHIFSYSKRAGTEAAVMNGQIPEEIKKERNRILTELCDDSGNEIISSYIGKEASVLFETFDGVFAYGHTDNFIEVKAEATSDVCGNILPVEIIGGENKLAIAKLI